MSVIGLKPKSRKFKLTYIKVVGLCGTQNCNGPKQLNTSSYIRRYIYYI